MMSSRGMGAIRKDKIPGAKVKKRRDNTDFLMFAEGGAIWDKKRPAKLGASKKLSPEKKAKAKSAAKKAGRPYPNLVDNIRAAKG